MQSALANHGQTQGAFLGGCLGESPGCSFKVVRGSWPNPVGILEQLPWGILWEIMQTAGGISSSSLGFLGEGVLQNPWEALTRSLGHFRATAFGRPWGNRAKCLRDFGHSLKAFSGDRRGESLGKSSKLLGGCRQVPWRVLEAFRRLLGGIDQILGAFLGDCLGECFEKFYKTLASAKSCGQSWATTIRSPWGGFCEVLSGGLGQLLGHSGLTASVNPKGSLANRRGVPATSLRESLGFFAKRLGNIGKILGAFSGDYR